MARVDYHLGQPCQYHQRYDQQLVRNPFECLMGKLFKRSLPTKVILERILIETFTWCMIQLMLMMEYFSFNAVIYNNFALHDDCTLRKSVKSVRIQSYSGSYFAAFGLTTERWGVSLRSQSEFGKLWTRITPNTDTFLAVVFIIWFKTICFVKFIWCFSSEFSLSWEYFQKTFWYHQNTINETDVKDFLVMAFVQFHENKYYVGEIFEEEFNFQ